MNRIVILLILAALVLAGLPSGSVASSSSPLITTSCPLILDTVAIQITESGLPVATNFTGSINGTAIWENTSAQTVLCYHMGIPANQQLVPWTAGTALKNIGSPSQTAYASNLTVGQVDVTHTESLVKIFVSFAPAYPLTVLQTGLTGGDAWWANTSGGWCGTNGGGCNSPGGGGLRWVPNGSYTITGQVSAGPSWSDPPSQSATIFGSGVVVTFNFQWAITNVTFDESGLPTGTSWGITLMHTTGPPGLFPNYNVTTTGKVPSIVFTPGGSLLINGTVFHYLVVAPTGYHATTQSANITMPDPVNVTFVANSSGCPSCGPPGGGGGGGNGTGGGGIGGTLGGGVLGEPLWLWLIALVVIVVGIALIIEWDEKKWTRKRIMGGNL